MADSLTLNLQGAEKFDRMLDHLTHRGARKVVTAGLRAGAQELKKAANRTAPIRRRQRDRIITFSAKSSRVRAPGFLKRGVIYRAVKGGYPTFLVGPRRTAFYGKFFEFGRDGPRFPRNPWLSSAFRASGGAMINRITDKLWLELKAEIDRHGK